MTLFKTQMIINIKYRPSNTLGEVIDTNIKQTQGNQTFLSANVFISFVNIILFHTKEFIT